ncbi:DUF6391 domain-containing protein [Nitrolancea hollandica]|uniref:Uncharacterized protein n=1 Tax=Nitrolancea hollandica Lb TaxID=1129897 RepID=I4ECI2_9BACT|nr:DUF6391 domain-containing protein [Nitrolancea hollandica]CCF82394.1 conserved membrane hypothetical protein [Nitrolancea hollandica Lb]
MLVAIFGLMVFVFVAFIAIVLTAGLTLGSLVTLVRAPGQLLTLLHNQTLRRNHALEHATVNVIEERYGPSRLSGLAQPGGFIIQGGAPPELVADAAREALTRLRAGEWRLAIHRRCGTTLLAAQLVMAIAFLTVLLVTGEFSFLPFVVGILAAVLLARVVSPILQRFITTNARVGSMTITGVEIQPPANSFGIVSMIAPGPVFVHTSQSGSTIPSERGNDGRVTIITGDQDEVPVGDYRVR